MSFWLSKIIKLWHKYARCPPWYSRFQTWTSWVVGLCPTSGDIIIFLSVRTKSSPFSHEHKSKTNSGNCLFFSLWAEICSQLKLVFKQGMTIMGLAFNLWCLLCPICDGLSSRLLHLLSCRLNPPAAPSVCFVFPPSRRAALSAAFSLPDLILTLIVLVFFHLLITFQTVEIAIC